MFLPTCVSVLDMQSSFSGRQGGSNTLGFEVYTFQQCGSNQPECRTHTVPWSRVVRAAMSNVDVEQLYPRDPRQSASEAATRKTAALEVPQPITLRRLQMDSAQEGASRRARACQHDDRETSQQTQIKRSLSAWRPHSASRWCSQLKKTADGEFVPVS